MKKRLKKVRACSKRAKWNNLKKVGAFWIKNVSVFWGSEAQYFFNHATKNQGFAGGKMERVFFMGTIMNVKSRLAGVKKPVSLDFLVRGRVWGQNKRSFGSIRGGLIMHFQYILF